MDRIILERFETSDQGTFGRMRIGDDVFFTGELPWRDNKNETSCIPCGTYTCKFTYSNRFKKFMYLVDGVNKRSGIRIHSANFMGDKTLGYKSELHGCIALGEKFGRTGKQKCIVLSTSAIRKFEKLMNGQTFILEVINGF